MTSGTFYVGSMTISLCAGAVGTMFRIHKRGGRTYIGYGFHGRV